MQLNKQGNFSARDIDWHHHRVMLNDSVRLEHYTRALQDAVVPNDVVADLGSGTGVLTFAAVAAVAAGASRAVGIEFSPELVLHSQELAARAGLNEASFLQGRTYDVELKGQLAPKLIVTETMGQLGPEENIVEICYDFGRRHAGVFKFLPAKLRIFCQPASTGHNWHDAHTLHGIVTLESVSGIRLLGDAMLLRTYCLGMDWDSSLEAEFTLNEPALQECDSMHIWFEAEFSPTNTLSTKWSAPLTHWKLAFVPRPHSKNRFRIMHVPGNEHLRVEWVP